jgi:hypothetical protein
MRKRPFATGLLLGLAALILILATTASAYLYKKPAGHDCGKATLIGGFGGPLPSNVPRGSKPQLHTFIVRGAISCAKAKRVMESYEKSFDTSAGAAKGKSPAGWKCAFSKQEGGDECTSSRATVATGLVYIAP